ncbi:MAG: RsmE family RNA methyltransferase [Flavobacteriales bacterium]|nr:RsmE family RNA methyltransferase [Flavobacteriales bacterium]
MEKNLSTFFLRNIEGDISFLSENDSRHAIKVLRHKNGDQLSIIDGLGIDAIAEILDAHPKKTKIKILKKKNKNKPVQLALAFCPTKSNDRNSFIFEKATEIGVTDFYPIVSQNSERRKWNSEKFKNIMVATLKQSKQFWMPKIYDVQDFDAFVKLEKLPNLKFIAHCKEDQKTSLKSLANNVVPQLILIGPEGDFTSEEITESKIHDFQSVNLGENRLRTETACIVSVTMMKF